ncbi:MAG: YiiX family permuted papain-like enzyme [Acidobacteriota bacterium]
MRRGLRGMVRVHGWIATAGLALLALVASGCHSGPALKDGDLVFHVSQSSQSQAIQAATDSPYSHVGLVVHRDGQPMVLEAISKVSLTPLAEWIARGENGHYVAKRLRDPAPLERPGVRQRMFAVGRPFLGRSYDLVFGWGDGKIYCSELVWKVYERGAGIELCPLRKLHEFDLDDPVVASKIAERYGDRVPLDQPVVAPSDLFDSPLLETIG